MKISSNTLKLLAITCGAYLTSIPAFSNTECKLPESSFNFGETSIEDKKVLFRLMKAMHPDMVNSAEKFESNNDLTETAAFAAYEALMCEKKSAPIIKISKSPQANATTLLRAFSSFYKTPKSIGIVCFTRVKQQTKTCTADSIN